MRLPYSARRKKAAAFPLSLLGAAFCSAVALGAPRPQQPAQSPAQPVFRAGVELVTIDVAVLGRDDQVIEGLTPDDFVVTVDGAPRRIATFRFTRSGTVDVGRSPVPTVAPVAPAEAEPGRTIVIVVDRDQIPAGEGRVFLEAAARFVDALPPADRVGLWTLPVAASELRLLTDRAQLKRLLLASVGTARPRMSDVKVSPDEAVAIAVRRDDRVRQDVIERECTRSMSGRAENLQRCIKEIDVEAPDMVRTLEAGATTMVHALQRLVESLAAIDGPKHVAIVSMGTFVTPELLRQVQAVGQTAAAARVHLHALLVSSRLEAARADIRGLSSVPQADQWGSADATLAGITGGLVVTTPAGEAAFARLTRVLAAAYILGVETEAGDRDGRIHKVEVRLARREGLTVRARQQFRIDPTVAVAASPVAAPPPREMRPSESAAPVTAPPPRAAGRPAVAETLAGMAAYIESFEREFSSAVAEERYVQIVRPWRGNPRSPTDEKALEWTEPGQKPKSSGPIIARRLLLSDVLLIQVAGERWLGYRDIAVVDGNSIRDRTERVRDLFLSRAADREGQLRRVVDESARYNLGDFKRNLNLPTLSLFLVHPRNRSRFDFEAVGEQTIDDAALQVIRYRERQRPTLIGTSSGRDVPVEGRLWIDPSTGHVVQTEVRFEPLAERRASIVVRYRRQASFSVLVPDYMWEWYESADVGGREISDRTLVECLARYANYRQFRVETSERIR